MSDEEVLTLYRRKVSDRHRAYLRERMTPDTDPCSSAWRKVWEEGLAQAEREAVLAVFEAGREAGYDDGYAVGANNASMGCE